MNPDDIEARRRVGTYLFPRLRGEGRDAIQSITTETAEKYLKRTKTGVVSERFRVAGARNAVVAFLRDVFSNGVKGDAATEQAISASLSNTIQNEPLLIVLKPKRVSKPKPATKPKPGTKRPARVPGLPADATDPERRAYVEQILASLGQATAAEIEERADYPTASASFIRYTLDRGVRGGTIKRLGPDGSLYAMGQPDDTTPDAWGETLFREAVRNIKSPFTMKQLETYIKKHYTYAESVLPNLQRTLDSGVMMLVLEQPTPTTYAFIVY